MSDGQLTPGAVLFLRGFKDHPNDSTVLSFDAPEGKGRCHLAVWLGTWTHGEENDGLTERLNALGWYFKDDPKLAEKLSARKQGDS